MVPSVFGLVSFVALTVQAQLSWGASLRAPRVALTAHNSNVSDVVRTRVVKSQAKWHWNMNTSKAEVAKLEADSRTAATYTMSGAVAFLHGANEGAYDFRAKFDSFPNVDLPQLLIDNQIMPVFLDAEVMQNSTDGEFKNLWWNKPHGLDEQESTLGIDLAYARIIKPFIQRMQNEYAVPVNKVIIGGFGLGGDMALQMLRLQPDLGGVFCLSGYLPTTSGVYSQLGASAGARRAPVFMAHGEPDMEIPIAWARNTETKLQDHSVQVEFTERPMLGHWLDEIEVMKLTDWIIATYQNIYEAA